MRRVVVQCCDRRGSKRRNDSDDNDPQGGNTSLEKRRTPHNCRCVSRILYKELRGQEKTPSRRFRGGADRQVTSPLLKVSVLGICLRQLRMHVYRYLISAFCQGMSNHPNAVAKDRSQILQLYCSQFNKIYMNNTHKSLLWTPGPARTASHLATRSIR